MVTSPLPPPPCVPKRVDKMRYFSRRLTTKIAPNKNRNNKSNNKAADQDLFIIKEQHQQPLEEKTTRNKSLETEKDSFFAPSNEDIIADLTAAERAKVWVHWKTTPVFNRPAEQPEDDGSTSTAPSSSTGSVESEETFTSSAAQLGGANRNITKDALSSASSITVTTTEDSTLTVDTPTISTSTLFSESHALPEPKKKPFTLMMSSPVAPSPTRRVRFNKENGPQIQYLTESLETISPEDKEQRWYSRREIAEQRKDMKQTILIIRQEAQGTDLFVDDSHLQPTKCVTGCERYHSMESRFMAQRMVVDAVVENKKMPSDELGELCRSLSQSSKELAAWHAKLVATQCWGLRGSQTRSPVTTHTDFKGKWLTCKAVEVGSNSKRNGKTTPIASSEQHRTPLPPQPIMEVEPFNIPSTKGTSGLDVPDLTEVTASPASPLEEQPVRLIPRIVSYKAEQSGQPQHMAVPASTEIHEAPSATSFKETLEKWRTLTNSTSQPSSAKLPAGSSTGRVLWNHNAGIIACGVCG